VKAAFTDRTFATMDPLREAGSEQFLLGNAVDVSVIISDFLESVDTLRQASLSIQSAALGHIEAKVLDDALEAQILDDTVRATIKDDGITNCR
jgi:hypothetical protein